MQHQPCIFADVHIVTHGRIACWHRTWLRAVEQTYDSDQLDLMLAAGYVNRLIGNARVVRFLAQDHADIFAEFQKLSDLQKAA